MIVKRQATCFKLCFCPLSDETKPSVNDRYRGALLSVSFRQERPDGYGPTADIPLNSRYRGKRKLWAKR